MHAHQELVEQLENQPGSGLKFCSRIEDAHFEEIWRSRRRVPRQGVEPRLTASKTVVLPSHSRGMREEIDADVDARFRSQADRCDRFVFACIVSFSCRRITGNPELRYGKCDTAFQVRALGFEPRLIGWKPIVLAVGHYTRIVVTQSETAVMPLRFTRFSMAQYSRAVQIFLTTLAQGTMRSQAPSRVGVVSPCRSV